MEKPIVGETTAAKKDVIHATIGRYTNKPSNEVDKKIVDKYFENGQSNWYDNQSKNNIEKTKSDWYDTKSLSKKLMISTKNQTNTTKQKTDWTKNESNDWKTIKKSMSKDKYQ